MNKKCWNEVTLRGDAGVTASPINDPGSTLPPPLLPRQWNANFPVQRDTGLGNIGAFSPLGTTLASDHTWHNIHNLAGINRALYVSLEPIHIGDAVSLTTAWSVSFYLTRRCYIEICRSQSRTSYYRESLTNAEIAGPEL